MQDRSIGVIVTRWNCLLRSCFCEKGIQIFTNHGVTNHGEEGLLV
jgi:hypothetical protein